MSETQSLYLVDITVTGEVTSELLDQQRAYLAGLTAQGSLLLAGVVPEIKGRGLAIVRADSLDDVRRIYADAPVVFAGVATVEVYIFRRTAGQIQAI